MSENKKLHNGAEMLNVREACVLMRMSDGGLYGLVKRGVLPPPTRLPTPTTAGGIIELNHWSLDDLLEAKTSGKVRPRKKYAIGETKKYHKSTMIKESGVNTQELPPAVDLSDSKKPKTVVQEALDVTQDTVDPMDALRELAEEMRADKSARFLMGLLCGIPIGVALMVVLERFA